MYRRFYNLQRNPFEITPDPSFLFPTQRHNEALAALYYGVLRRKGFVVLTGEVGTGKTLLVRYLLRVLKDGDVACAYVFNSRLAPHEFLQYAASDLGLQVDGKTKSDLLLSLSNFLIERHKKRLTTVLVVDEAHHLAPEVLEEIRLLTNLETTQEKLIQILLVGQPELDEKLDSVDLRQLKQRIALRSHLKALDHEETRGYIKRRLELAGADTHAPAIFSADAIEEIVRHSRGIPRLVNTLCENALITGYAKQARPITPEIINGVAADFRLGVVHSPVAPRPKEASAELLEAVQRLLNLHDYLVAAQTKEESLPLIVSSGASKHEPYI